MEETKVEEKKYELKKPIASDIFILSSIIGKIGVNKFANCLQNEGVQGLVKSMQNNNKSKVDIDEIVGIGVFTEIAQIVLEGMPKCENEIYKLLSSVSNLSLEDVKTLDGVTFIEMIIDFFKMNGDFIKAASKFVK